MSGEGEETGVDTAAIRARVNAATEGPWSAADEHGLIPGAFPAWCVSQMSEDGRYIGDVAHLPQGVPTDEADAAFIAHARQDIPKLLDEVERLRDACKLLGKTLHESLTDVVDASGRHDLIEEDGDGDWELVWESLAALRPQRDAALATIAAVKAVMDHLDVARAEGLVYTYGAIQHAVREALDGEK